MFISFSFLFILVTASGGRPKPEFRFLSRQLRSRALLLKDRYGVSLSGRGSKIQPSNWEADILPLSYCRPHSFASKAVPLLWYSRIPACIHKHQLLLTSFAALWARITLILFYVYMILPLQGKKRSFSLSVRRILRILLQGMRFQLARRDL